MTNDLLDKIDVLRKQALGELEGIDTSEKVLAFKNKFLGRKGEVTELMKLMGRFSKEERPLFGQKINALKQLLTENLEEKFQSMIMKSRQGAIEKERIDITLPGRITLPGYKHPIMQALERVTSIFIDMGFSVYEGPEIETEYYNFEALNVPKDHPARDMQDTFYINESKLLRTHTSPVQIHIMEKHKPPVLMIAPGRVYRRDNDITHSPMFYQVEGLYVDKEVTFGDLKGVITLFCHRLFGDSYNVRFRPSFFPFTEPSAEVDISCVICQGKGCRVCKQTGWLEIMGCGMVDPEVFSAVKYNPKSVNGFAFGMGIDRIAMLLYGINHIRLFYENDMRFLEQF